MALTKTLQRTNFLNSLTNFQNYLLRELDYEKQLLEKNKNEYKLKEGGSRIIDLLNKFTPEKYDEFNKEAGKLLAEYPELAQSINYIHQIAATEYDRYNKKKAFEKLGLDPFDAYTLEVMKNLPTTTVTTSQGSVLRVFNPVTNQVVSETRLISPDEQRAMDEYKLKREADKTALETQSRLQIANQEHKNRLSEIETEYKYQEKLQDEKMANSLKYGMGNDAIPGAIYSSMMETHLKDLDSIVTLLYDKVIGVNDNIREKVILPALQKRQHGILIADILKELGDDAKLEPDNSITPVDVDDDVKRLINMYNDKIRKITELTEKQNEAINRAYGDYGLIKPKPSSTPTNSKNQKGLWEDFLQRKDQ